MALVPPFPEKTGENAPEKKTDSQTRPLGSNGTDTLNTSSSSSLDTRPSRFGAGEPQGTLAQGSLLNRTGQQTAPSASPNSNTGLRSSAGLDSTRSRASSTGVGTGHVNGTNGLAGSSSLGGTSRLGQASGKASTTGTAGSPSFSPSGDTALSRLAASRAASASTAGAASTRLSQQSGTVSGSRYAPSASSVGASTGASAGISSGASRLGGAEGRSTGITGALGAGASRSGSLGSTAPRAGSFTSQRGEGATRPTFGSGTPGTTGSLTGSAGGTGRMSSSTGMAGVSRGGASLSSGSSLGAGSSLSASASRPSATGRMASSSSLAPGTASARPSLGAGRSTGALGVSRDDGGISDEEFSQLQEFIYTQCGIFIADTRKYLVENRLSNRLRELNLKSFNEYYYYLRFDKNKTDELQKLFNVITTNETSFYRNPPQLKVFQDVVVPQELEKIRASGQRKLRIWSAGCSTGEEPYTLAIILKEVLQGQLSQWDIKITANDLSEDVLRAAQRGIYSDYALRTTPPEIVERHFTKEGATFHIDPSLKRMVSFGSINLSNKAMLKRVERSHIVFCRNVIIYFDEEMKRQVIESFYDNLLPGGCMLIGHSESLHNLSRAFTPEHHPGTIVYRKQE